MTDSHTQTDTLGRLLLRVCGAGLAGLALIGILAWLTGHILTDRFLWSQFLFWIPTPVALLLAALGLIASLRPVRTTRRRRRRLVMWSLIIAGLLVYFTTIEHRFLHRSPSPGSGLRIMHWTMSHLKLPLNLHSRRIAQLAGDITILSDAGALQWDQIIEHINDPSAQTIKLGRFWIMSYVPILEARAIVKSEGVEVSFIRFESTAKLGRSVTVYLIDLPSDPKMQRFEQAVKTRRWLDESDAPPPDIVVGDFNSPRGSRSIARLFPELHHAFDDGGQGYGASYHRTFPPVPH